jgi:ubiquinone/menaquinone biosynthesis C-methylase UbiE
MDQYPFHDRPPEERGTVCTEEQRRIAQQYSKEFFDGDRFYGYGGYSYDARFWQTTVKRIRDYYNLPEDASVLDVGCAKGFLLHDFKQLMPNLTIAGIDISEYAIENAIEDVKPYLKVANAKELPYPDKSFDLVLSINSLQNLPLEECKLAIAEVQRVTRSHAFIVVDICRNEEDREKQLKWNLIAKTYLHPNEWVKLFEEVGYKGDYYWWFINKIPF